MQITLGDSEQGLMDSYQVRHSHIGSIFVNTWYPGHPFWLIFRKTIIANLSVLLFLNEHYYLLPVCLIHTHTLTCTHTESSVLCRVILILCHLKSRANGKRDLLRVIFFANFWSKVYVCACRPLPVTY